MSGELFLLITANFNFVIVYLGSHVTPKRHIESKGCKEDLTLEYIEEKVEQDDGGDGGVPRDNGGVSARKQAGKDGKKGRGRCWSVEK